MSTLPAATAEKSSLDAKLVNSFLSATTEVLTTMANTRPTLKNVQPQLDFVPSGDISSVIGIMGDKGEGMVALSFPTALANLIVSRLLGTAADSVTSEDRCDGIGEVVNMVSGNAKIALSKDQGTSYRLSLPSIIQGNGHEVARPKNAPYLVMTFEAEGQEFHLQLTFKFC